MHKKRTFMNNMQKHSYSINFSDIFKMQPQTGISCETHKTVSRTEN